jgi:hypothetical protein
LHHSGLRKREEKRRRTSAGNVQEVRAKFRKIRASEIIEAGDRYGIRVMANEKVGEALERLGGERGMRWRRPGVKACD